MTQDPPFAAGSAHKYNKDGAGTGVNLPLDGVFPARMLDPGELAPAPIRPHWILEGTPEAKCKTLSVGTRGWATTDHWSCTAGKFHWYYGWDESVVFLEGEAFITDAQGKTYHGVPGVTVFFPAGTSATWHVPHYIRKLAFNDRPVPKPAHYAVRLVDKTLALFTRKKPASGGLK